jgi:hypothetical protein
MKNLINFVLIRWYSRTANSSSSDSQRRNFPNASGVSVLFSPFCDAIATYENADG